jgi:hypothetical protein
VLRLVLAGAAVLAGALAPAPASAQNATGSLRGYVRDAQGAALAATEIRARHVGTGAVRTTSTNEEGFYILPGLVPAEYEVSVRRMGGQPQTRRVRVLIGTAIEVDFAIATAAVQMAEIQVQAAPAVDMRTSEVAVNVTPVQIENLPTANRNFLDFAVLAPGVRLSGDRVDDTRRTIAYGAQGADQINVFVDGVSYKNDMIQGGVAGQDASRGNPFPLSAIQEYRILTQNYRAEYQKASSAILTTLTRSGTNTFSGNTFIAYQNRGLVALDQFQREDAIRDPSYTAPDYTRYLYGLSLGGPIIRNRLFFFGTYEGNNQDRSARVSITPPTGYPALDSIDWASRNGEFGSPFNQSLFFGKLTWDQTARSSFELSVSLRNENDIRDFGGTRAYEQATRFNNAVNATTLRHRYASGAWLNEATASFQRYRYNPVPANPAPSHRSYNFGAQIGSYVSMQDFTQDRLGFRNDLTYTGLRWAGRHVIKVGGNLDLASYDIVKRNSEIPNFVFETGFDSARTPQRVEWQSGDPVFAWNNSQVGLYLQDDWNPTSRLTINAGVRWDYESGQINTNYVTPQNVVDSLTKYQDSLYFPLDPERYFTDGTQRSPYLGAFQPRLGFSYMLDRAGRTTVYGGWGLFQDRTLVDQAIEESFAQQHPGYTIFFEPNDGVDTDPNLYEWDPTYLNRGKPALDSLIAGRPSNTQEVKLLPNDLRPPMAQQYTLGIRRLIGSWAFDLAYTGVRSNNVFTFYWANMNFTCPERAWSVANCWNPNTVPGFGTILLADNAGKTWYDAINLKIERPFARGAGDLSWGAGISYAWAQRQTQGYNDNYSFPNPVDYPKQLRNDERQRVVANWVLESRRLGGAQISGLFTVASGIRYDVGDRFGGPSNPFRAGAYNPPTFVNLDLRLRKEFRVRNGNLGLSLDFFNALNNQNYGCYNTFSPNDANFGVPGCMASDPQRIQVGMDLGF